MPALNFKKQFAPKVESWEKLQTIRARRKDYRDPRAGQTLYLYTGMRTKSCRKLGEVECRETQQITIEENLDVIVGTHCLSVTEEIELAESDGFPGRVEFYQFFRDTHGLPFHGLIIKWDKPDKCAPCPIKKKPCDSRQVDCPNAVNPQKEHSRDCEMVEYGYSDCTCGFDNN